MRWTSLAVLAAAGLAVAGCGGSKYATREFTVPSSSMEPTLHCAKPFPGWLGTTADRVVVDIGKPVERGDIVLFRTPRRTALVCGAGGIFVKRLVGLPGETIGEDGRGFISVNGKRLAQRYISARTRASDSAHFHQTWHVPAGDYFLVGDNLPWSCDSRMWGGVPRKNIIGPVVKIIHG
jgi:signal peptidase I